MDESGRIEVMMEGLDRKLDLLLEGLNFLQGRAQRMEGELSSIQEDTACLPAMESAVKSLAPLVRGWNGIILPFAQGAGRARQGSRGSA